MKAREHSITALVDPHLVWQRWTDVSTWPQDDPGIRSVKLNGPVAKGAIGVLRFAHRNRRMPYAIVEVDRIMGRFVIEGKLFGATMRVIREMERAVPDGDEQPWALLYRVEFTGRFAKIWDRALGRPLEERLPAVLQRVAAASTMDD